MAFGSAVHECCWTVVMCLATDSQVERCPVPAAYRSWFLEDGVLAAETIEKRR
jgi:hypothetical protein